MADIATMAHQAQIVEYVEASAMALLIWDHIITLGQEIERMWSARWSFVKVLFLLNRYLVSAIIIFNCVVSLSHGSEDFCVFYLRWLVITICVSTAVVEGILLARVWALYRNDKFMLGVAIFAYAACVIALLSMTITDYVAFGVKIQGSFLPGCYAETVPSFIVGYWIAPVITETLLFALTSAKAVPWFGEKHSPPTLMLLARDSCVYFFIIFILLLSNLLVFKLAPPFFSSLMVSPSNAASCIAGSRMLFNLRGLHYEHNTSYYGGDISSETADSVIVYRRPTDTEFETGISSRAYGKMPSYQHESLEMTVKPREGVDDLEAPTTPDSRHSVFVINSR